LAEAVNSFEEGGVGTGFIFESVGSNTYTTISGLIRVTGRSPEVVRESPAATKVKAAEDKHVEVLAASLLVSDTDHWLCGHLVVVFLTY